MIPPTCLAASPYHRRLGAEKRDAPIGESILSAGQPRARPGEVRDIGIVSEGDTWVILAWNPPVLRSPPHGVA